MWICFVSRDTRKVLCTVYNISSMLLLCNSYLKCMSGHKTQRPPCGQGCQHPPWCPARAWPWPLRKKQATPTKEKQRAIMFASAACTILCRRGGKTAWNTYQSNEITIFKKVPCHIKRKLHWPINVPIHGVHLKCFSLFPTARTSKTQTCTSWMSEVESDSLDCSSPKMCFSHV